MRFDRSAVACALVVALAACGSSSGTPSWGDDGGATGGSSSGGGSGGVGSSGASSSGASSSGASSSGGNGSSSGASSSGASSSGASSSGASSSGGNGSSSGASGSSSGGSSSGGSSSGSGGSSGGGGPITCPAPGSYAKNGGSCGTERWNIKTGTDSQAASVSLVPKATTIAQLASLSAAGGGSSRESPTETTLWELKDVTLSMIKLETDSDYHIVLGDGSQTLIVEIPYPDCAQGSAWSCFISRARAEIDSKFSVTSSPQYPAQTVTVRGVGFFDSIHGQTGVAPNGIELHALLQICFGQGCTPS